MLSPRHEGCVLPLLEVFDVLHRLAPGTWTASLETIRRQMGVPLFALFVVCLSRGPNL